MKKLIKYIQLFLPVFFLLAVLKSPAQEYTLTTTAANVIASKALIDLPGLTGNINAIIVATPLGNTKSLNPHPVGAWYYSGKWNIFNSNHAPMPLGLTYKVQYFLSPGPNQFLHLVTQQSLGSEGSYIDNSALNNKPNVQFTIFQNHSPDVRSGSWLNQYEAKAGYSASAGKWYITNIGGQPLQAGCAYNIVIPSGTSMPPNPTDTSGNGACICPASLPPNGVAGGDLAGSYPNPVVQKVNGYPVSAIAPQVGDVLKWDGTTWAPAADDKGGTVTGTTSSGIKVFEYYLSNKIILKDQWGVYDFPGLDQTINIPTTSTVIVSMTAEGNNNGCVACPGGMFHMKLHIDNMQLHSQVLTLVVLTYNNTGFVETSALKTVTLAPGNHRFKITSLKYQGADMELLTGILGFGTKMTIIIIPQ
jgi:hypothetical protein